MPDSSTLRNLAIQIQGTEEKIFRLQRPPIPDHGTVDLMDTTAGPDDIAMAALMTEAICSTAEEIQERYTAVEALDGSTLGDHVRRAYVTWREGSIDCGQSYIR